MDTNTVTRAKTAPRGVALVTAYNLDTELTALYAAQDLWLKEQARIGEAVTLLEDYGYKVRPHRSTCWADSPHAARIAEIESQLEI
jgi:hypothetical protein